MAKEKLTSALTGDLLKKSLHELFGSPEQTHLTMSKLSGDLIQLQSGEASYHVRIIKGDPDPATGQYKIIQAPDFQVGDILLTDKNEKVVITGGENGNYEAESQKKPSKKFGVYIQYEADRWIIKHLPGASAAAVGFQILDI